MDVDFEVAHWSPKFVHPIAILKLKVLNHVSVLSKNLGQDVSFEGSNIFVGKLKVGF